MATTCFSDHDPRAPSAATQSGAARLAAFWRPWLQSWRDSARRHAELRALDGLDDRTLHDIGLAERRMGGDLPGSWRDLPGAWRDPRNVL